MKMKKITIQLITLMFLLVGTATAQDYVIIVHSSNTESSITSSDLSKIFLKKQSNFKNGTKAVPVDQTNESAVRESFSKEVMNRSISAMKNYWSQQLFSGSAIPPDELANDAAVISFVASNPGAIGYVSASADVSGVKVLSVE